MKAPSLKYALEATALFRSLVLSDDLLEGKAYEHEDQTNGELRHQVFEDPQTMQKTMIGKLPAEKFEAIARLEKAFIFPTSLPRRAHIRFCIGSARFASLIYRRCAITDEVSLTRASVAIDHCF